MESAQRSAPATRQIYSWLPEPHDLPEHGCLLRRYHRHKRRVWLCWWWLASSKGLGCGDWGGDTQLLQAGQGGVRPGLIKCSWLSRACTGFCNLHEQCGMEAARGL